ncbi:MAG: putative glycoside hydrolase [Candidatus Bipolaricaulis sp.]|nr:putative glycoside hydrolase [Candidatus Bipolaricaulis sp.]
MGRRKSILCLFLAAAFVSLFFLPSDRGATSQTTTAAPPRLTGHGRVGVYLTAYGLLREDILRGVLEARKAGKIDTLVINVKDNHGDVSYASNVPLVKALGASTGLLDFKKLIPILRGQGFYLIARQVVFNDPILAKHLGYPNGWVPAADPTAIAYNLSIAQEVATLGFDELQFDYIRYADGGGLASGYEARYAAIDSFLTKVEESVGSKIALSVDLFGRVMWDWNVRRTDPIGQSLEDMSAHVDYVSPMLYPSHYTEQKYKDGPYLVVKDAMVSGKKRTSTAVRPFLQVFDMAIPAGMTIDAYIAAEIRAAKDYGADGYLFWEPSNDYRALYRVLGVPYSY